VARGPTLKRSPERGRDAAPGQRVSRSAEALGIRLSLVILAGPAGGQSRGGKFDERLDQELNVPAAGIDGIKPANRRRVVAEDAAQPPVLDRRPGDLVGQLSDAVTRNCCGNHHRHVWSDAYVRIGWSGAQLSGCSSRPFDRFGAPTADGPNLRTAVVP
jgi:hypothetical protein